MLANITYQPQQTKQSNRVTMRVKSADIPVESYITLARAVVKQAVLDAAGAGVATKDERTEAADWLTSADGILFETLSGIDPYEVRCWVRRGCPYDRQEVRRLQRINRQQPDND